MKIFDFFEEAYTVVEKITDGCSGDEKYKLEKDGKFFLLRVGDKSKAPERKKEFDRLKAYADKYINTSKPVAFGTAEDKFYSFVTWVDGTPIMDIIKQDTSKSYYRLGIKVGIELKKLHLACQADTNTDWQDIIEKKAASLMEYYHRMNFDIACGKNAERYIKENISLVSDRPQAVLHGDFHWNNCVVDDAGSVGIIDFSGNDTGDPWYDFGGLLWALEYSGSFANGQIDGYFGTPPSEFWAVFKLYTALYAFEHLPYNNGTSEDIKNHISNAERMLKIFGDDFETELPLFRTQMSEA